MNTSRIAVLFGMEYRRHWQSLTVRILLGLLLLLVLIGGTLGTAITSGDPSVGGQKAWVNSEFNVTVLFRQQFWMLYLFFVTIAAGLAVPQEDRDNVRPVLHSTGLTAGEYILGKFLAVFALFATVVVAHMLTMLVSHQLAHLWKPADVFGPFSLMAYVKPVFVFVLPTMLGLIGLAFLIGTATRRSLLAFLFPVCLFLLVPIISNWSPSWLDRRIDALLTIIDPNCSRWMSATWFYTDRGAEFYNTHSVGLDLVFWLNRGFWLVVGCGSVLLSWRLFARSLRGSHGAKSLSAIVASRPQAFVSVGRQNAIASVVAPTFFSGLWPVMWMETRFLLRHPALYILLPLTLLLGLAVMLTSSVYLEFALLVTPGNLAVLLFDVLTTTMTLLLMFFMVASLERERKCGLSPLFVGTPLWTSSIFAGKILANGLVGAVVLLLNFVAAWGLLLYQGVFGMEMMPFVLVWGLLLVPTCFVWCAFVLFVHSLFQSRYATYGISLAVITLFGMWDYYGKLTWANNWMLSSALIWSDMGVMELDRTAIIVNRLLAMGLGVLFVMLSLRVYARRDRDRTQLVESFRWRPMLWEMAKFAPLVLVVGGLYTGLSFAIDYGPEGESVAARQRDYWKKNHATWRDTHVPAVVDVDVKVELDPARGWFRTDGSYLIKNDSTEPLKRIPVTVGTHFTDLTWTLDGKEYEPKNNAGLYVFTPEKAIAPNETMRIGFAFEGKYPFGISKRRQGAREFILPSGVVLHSMGMSFVPMVGYVDGVGLDAKHQFEQPEFEEDHYLKELPPMWGSAVPFTVRLAVTGPTDYTYNGVGTLIKDETDGKLRTMVWKSDHPVRVFNVIAGRWETERGKDVAVNYHKKHRYNVAEITKALEASREHYSKWYGAYPWKELRLSQFPAMSGYAQGFPTNVVFTEGMMLSQDSFGGSAFMITAHEAAHQWWGNMLTPSNGPGANILSEGMANYSAGLLLDTVKGPKYRIEFCKFMENNYVKNRRIDAEQPIVKILGDKPGDQTVTYDKGGWVFWMLDQHLGREQMHAGLRRFIARYQDSRRRPSIEDLLDILSEQAQDKEAFKQLTKQLFFEVNLPEYKLEGVSRTEEGDKSGIKGTLKNAGTGTFTVEVAVVKGNRFGKDGEVNSEYREERVTVVVDPSKPAEFVITAPFTPDRVVVDPDVRVLQLWRDKTQHTF